MHTVNLPSGRAITFPPVTIRRLIAAQGLKAGDLPAQSAWLADVCGVDVGVILDLEISDFHALSRGVQATLAPSKEDAAPLGDGPAQPARAA